VFTESVPVIATPPTVLPVSVAEVIPQRMPVCCGLHCRRLPPRKIENGIEAAEGRVIVDPALHVHAYRSPPTSVD